MKKPHNFCSTIFEISRFEENFAFLSRGDYSKITNNRFAKFPCYSHAFHNSFIFPNVPCKVVKIKRKYGKLHICYCYCLIPYAENLGRRIVESASQFIISTVELRHKCSLRNVVALKLLNFSFKISTCKWKCFHKDIHMLIVI